MMDRTTGAARTFHRTTSYGAVAALCALLLAGCAGGSGSSGFDIVAAENTAIDRALDSGDCVVERGLTICASGAGASPGVPSPTPTHTGVPSASRTATVATTTTPTETPFALPSATTTSAPTPSATGTGTHGPARTPTATVPPAAPSVDIQPDPTDVAHCADVADAQPCALRIAFVPMAVPAGAAYRAAVRARNPDGAWRVLPVADNVVEVEVPPAVAVVQTAILVYERDPGPVPGEVEVLSDSGADFAFVSPPLVVRSSP